MRGAKRIFIELLTVFMLFGLSGCCLKHEWAEATCDAPKTCIKCGETEGESLGHEWTEATCETPKNCARCGKTEGDALGHNWIEADCETPKTCSRCIKTEGEALGHKWLENTPNYQQPKTCEVCGKTEGEALEADVAALDSEFAELDKVYDWTLKWSGNSEDQQEGKVWWTNYRIFDSDETHEAQEGYEYRSVECWLATEADVQYYSNPFWFSDYYEEDFEFDDEDSCYEVLYFGENYNVTWLPSEQIEREIFVHSSKKYDYSKWGWNNWISTWAVRYTWKVPKGYDGIIVSLFDIDEHDEKGIIEEDCPDTVAWYNLFENITAFRMK